LPRRFVPGGVPSNPSVDVCAIDLDDYDYVRTSARAARFLFCMDFSPDGMHLIYGHAIDRNIVTRSSTTVPWDLDAIWAGPVGQVRPSRINVQGIQWAPDGLGFYDLNAPASGTPSLQQWSLETPYTMGNNGEPLPTLVAEREMGDSPAGASGFDNFRISPDGTKMLCMLRDSARSIAKYDFTGAPWDINNMFYTNGDVDDPAGNSVAALYVPPSGNCAYTVAGNVIQQWALSPSWEASLVNDLVPSQTRSTFPQIPNTCSGGSATNCRIDTLWLNDTQLYVAVQDTGVENSVIHQYSR
jgi:hypothetical protein